MDASVVKTVLLMEFAAPSALSTDTVGTLEGTTVDGFTPKTPNLIRDIRNPVAVGAGLNYKLLTARLDETRKTLGYTADFIATNQRLPPVIGEAGLFLKAGFFQFVERQLTGVLTAQDYSVTLDMPLNV